MSRKSELHLILSVATCRTERRDATRLSWISFVALHLTIDHHHQYKSQPSTIQNNGRRISISTYPREVSEIQLDLMKHLYEAIEGRKVAIVESPTGAVCIKYNTIITIN